MTDIASILAWPLLALSLHAVSNVSTRQNSLHDPTTRHCTDFHACCSQNQLQHNVDSWHVLTYLHQPQTLHRAHATSMPEPCKKGVPIPGQHVVEATTYRAAWVEVVMTSPSGLRVICQTHVVKLCKNETCHYAVMLCLSKDSSRPLAL